MKDIFEKNKGITLVALVITVIILIILASVSLSVLFSENGLINKAKEGTSKYEDEAIRESINLAVLNASSNTGLKLDENILKNELDKKLGEGKYTYTINEETGEVTVVYNGKEYKIGTNGVIEESSETDYSIIDNDSIIGKISGITTSGVQNITVNGKTYSADVIVCDGNLVLDGSDISIATKTLVEGKNIYEFGNKETDVAKSNGSTIDDAQNAVILKVNGNLTINSNCVLTACKSDDGYGGPKGLFVYCAGTLTNNGEISMTARGAVATGEDIYLWKNNSGNYETVPAAGESGLARFTANEMIASCQRDISSGNGIIGNYGKNRKTGSGGQGGYITNGNYGSSDSYIGVSTAGTSYAGGNGTGGLVVCNTYAIDDSYTKATNVYGGDGYAYDVGNSYYFAGAGAGIIGGTSAYCRLETTNTDNRAGSGTGGLLVIYADRLNNSGTISSNGSNGAGAWCNLPGEYKGAVGGGGSGGGSVNVFYKSVSNMGTIIANGGVGGDVLNATTHTMGCFNGGNGGSGAVTVGSVSTGSFEPVNINDGIIKKISELTNNGIQNIVANGKIYSADVIIYNGNLTLDGSEISIATKTQKDGKNVYEFGNKNTDVAEMNICDRLDEARNAVVLKVNGDLTINTNNVLTSCKSDNGYGGPKGLFIYCSGTIINNGEISMTERGSIASGEEIYLWKNADETYEIIPAFGAPRLEENIPSSGTNIGVQGNNATGRGTGSGGQGGYLTNGNNGSSNSYMGASSSGKTYAGGNGAGGLVRCNASALDSSYTRASTVDGGNGNAYDVGNSYYFAGAGAGIIAGTSGYIRLGSENTDYTGGEGSGGLLVIYANELNNQGTISSNGSNGAGAWCNLPGEYKGAVGGGGSGGGSINVFYRTLSNIGTITANGGAGGDVQNCIDGNMGCINGGAGGNGTVTLGNVSSGNFVEN